MVMKHATTLTIHYYAESYLHSLPYRLGHGKVTAMCGNMKFILTDAIGLDIIWHLYNIYHEVSTILHGRLSGKHQCKQLHI